MINVCINLMTVYNELYIHFLLFNGFDCGNRQNYVIGGDAINSFNDQGCSSWAGAPCSPRSSSLTECQVDCAKSFASFSGIQHFNTILAELIKIFGRALLYYLKLRGL